MPIEKIKHPQKPLKRKNAEQVSVAPDLETKRQAFKKAAAHRVKKAGPKHHTNRKRTLIIAVAAVFVAFGSTLVAFAYHWYQGPEATIMQSIANAANTPSASYTGTLSIYGAKSSSFDGAYQPGKSVINTSIATPLSGDLSTLKLSILSTNQNIYAKLNNASDVAIQTAPPDQQSIFRSIIPQFASRINDKWIAINKDEIGAFKATTGLSQCMIDIFENFTTASSSRQELTTVYTKHPFMDIVSASDNSDGSGVYTVAIQPNQFDSFMTELYRSQYFASLAGCSKQNDAVTAKDIAGFYAQLTIDKSEHRIKIARIYTGDKTLTTLIVTPKFGDIKTITEPTDAFSLDTIKSEIMKRLLAPAP